MPELPSGTVTFLFTDLEVSTRLWDQEPEAMSGALARHDEILRAAVETQDGVVVKGRGDGFHAVFATADAAVRAAVECELAMSAQLWPVSEPLRARIGIHTGVAELRDDDYFGSAVNRAARLEAIAHGGQILCSETTADLARDALPEAVDLIDLGEHRLRDLSRPERVFQVIAPGLAGDFPPLRSLDAFPGNLPRQLTSFVGREEEVASLAAALTEASLVTVTGVGGVGKTRLAMQVAADVAPRFTDGAWLCELATALDAESLVQVVASTLGVAPRQGLTLEGSIREYLRAKQILVVLDNCEHLLRAAGDLAEGLLVDCPGVQLLATSREGLAIAGEQVWPLRALGIPREASTTADVSASDAARLFVERARAARPSFALDDTNAQAVSEICRRLDGMPLAIELAAARVSALRPREIASLLDERFRLLTGGRRTAIERHQTLRATVDWSYSLLDERERLVFERLGVFVGGFDVAAASAVVDGAGVERWDIVDALGELVAKSMLTTDDEPTATTRYKMFETIRAYAHERLDESGSADVWRRRHAEHFADFAEVAGPELAGADELTWRPRLHDELDNLRAAVGWALDRDDPADQDLALRVIAALANQSYLGRAAGISAWAVRALPHAEQSPPGRRTAVLAAAAQDVIYQGDYAGGRALGIDALRDGLTADCPAPYLAYLAIAECDTFHGKHREALTTMAQAHAAIDAIGGDAFSTSAIRSAEAVFTAMSGDFDNARPQADEALRLARKLGNPSNLAMALFALGSAHWEDDPQRAVAALDESIAFTRAGASAIMFGPALSLAARVHARTGTHTRALESLRESILACADTGDRPALFSVLDRGIEVLAAVGDADGAAVLAGIVTVGPFRDLTSLQGGPEEEARGRIIEGLRAELGVDRFTATTARGAAMSYDELIDYSLGQVDRLMSEAGHSIT